jgi:hypothetical protein
MEGGNTPPQRRQLRVQRSGSGPEVVGFAPCRSSRGVVTETWKTALLNKFFGGNLNRQAWNPNRIEFQPHARRPLAAIKARSEAPI